MTLTIPDGYGAALRCLPGVAVPRLTKVEVMVYRAPIATPVQTSFGLMLDRPAVIVRLTDVDGQVGHGEVWCNFPSVGAEHRARLLIDTVAPLLLAGQWDSPVALTDSLSRHLDVLAIQSGEPGPIAQVIAGVDLAAWELVARRAGKPLWRVLGGSSSDSGEPCRVPVYASGLNPTEPQLLAQRRAEEGYRAFKLKVGFGEQRDGANLASLRRQLGDHTPLMVDANQAWDLATAIRMAQVLEPFGLEWLEEPLRADAPIESWQTLASRSAIRLAAGENLRGAQFEAMLDASVLSVLQPDLAKWGGFSACVGLGREALARGLRLCPHWLGAGVGLAASMHLKAAIGGAGMVEIDANPNPLRERLAGPLLRVDEGHVVLPEAPGLGYVPDLDSVRQFQTLCLTAGK